MDDAGLELEDCIVTEDTLDEILSPLGRRESLF